MRSQVSVDGNGNCRAKAESQGIPLPRGPETKKPAKETEMRKEQNRESVVPRIQARKWFTEEGRAVCVTARRHFSVATALTVQRSWWSWLQKQVQ